MYNTTPFTTLHAIFQLGCERKTITFTPHITPVKENQKKNCLSAEPTWPALWTTLMTWISPDKVKFDSRNWVNVC